MRKFCLRDNNKNYSQSLKQFGVKKQSQLEVKEGKELCHCACVVAFATKTK